MASRAWPPDVSASDVAGLLVRSAVLPGRLQRLTDPLPVGHVPSLPHTADIISAVEFDWDGQHLATGDRGGRVVLFDRIPSQPVSAVCSRRWRTRIVVYWHTRIVTLAVQSQHGAQVPLHDAPRLRAICNHSWVFRMVHTGV